MSPVSLPLRRCECGNTSGRLLQVNELQRLSWPDAGDHIVVRYHLCRECVPGSAYLPPMPFVPTISAWNLYQ